MCGKKVFSLLSVILITGLFLVVAAAWSEPVTEWAYADSRPIGLETAVIIDQPAMVASARYGSSWRHGAVRGGPPYGRAHGYYKKHRLHRHRQHRSFDDYVYHRTLERHKRAYFGPRYRYSYDRYDRGTSWRLNSCFGDRGGYFCLNLRD